MTPTRSTISPLLEVRLSDGTRWRGTEAQLRQVHPDWLPYARRVPAHAPHHSPNAAPYGGHSASIHPDDMPPYTTDEQHRGDEEEDALAGYPDERARAAPRSAVHTLQRYEPEDRGLAFPFSDHAVEWHVGQPPPVRRASRHQPHPKHPAPDDGTVYQMPSVGGWRSHTEASATTATAKQKRRRVHPLLSLGLGMLVMLALWQAGIGVTSWWHLHQDDVTYGRPRTFQTDAVVGHFDSAVHPSHFVAENLHGRVVVFELPGGDASRTRVYVGPLLSGPGADLAPVTLTFPVIGGKTAMVVTVQDIHLVYLNKPIKGVWQFVEQQQG